MNKAANAYFQTKVSTTDQGQLLIMLYDGALRYLAQARDKIIAKDYAAKGVLISKVIDIINELSASLNMEKGGSLATNLNNLYVLCTARLLQANLKMNLESLDSVTHILSGLRSAYAQIIETPEAKRATAEIASRMQPAGSVTKKAQPVLNSPQPVGMSKGHANAAYGRMQAQPTAQAAAPTPPRPQAEAPRPQPVQTPFQPTLDAATASVASAQAQVPPQRAHVQQFAPKSSSASAAYGKRMAGAYAKVSS